MIEVRKYHCCCIVTSAVTKNGWAVVVQAKDSKHLVFPAVLTHRENVEVECIVALYCHSA